MAENTHPFARQARELSKYLVKAGPNANGNYELEFYFPEPVTIEHWCSACPRCEYWEAKYLREMGIAPLSSECASSGRLSFRQRLSALLKALFGLDAPETRHG